MFVFKLCLTLVTLFLVTQNVLTLELERYTILENSHYQPYEKLFKKRPNLRFNNTYTNQYLLNADTAIDRSKTKQLRVCFKNYIIVDDRRLKNSDEQFQDSRKITEYVLTKISKYTSLKFFLTTNKCHIIIDFRRSLPPNVLGETNFLIIDSQPRANIDIDYKQIQAFVRDYKLKLLKVFMQVLMHEMLHGLGVDHNDDDPEARSIIRQAYDFTTQQLLYKKDVYNLRAIYGPRHEHHTSNSQNVLNSTYYKDPSEWDPYSMDDITELPTLAPNRNRPNSQATSTNRNRPNSQPTHPNRNRSNSQTTSTNRNRPNSQATPSNRHRPNSQTTNRNRNRPNSQTTPANRVRPLLPTGNNHESKLQSELDSIQQELAKIKYSGLEKKRG